ncbi:TonB-dependent receptor [Filimonas lacunae]|nr:TonB-dependent receptor [Filimonas lacunae]
MVAVEGKIADEKATPVPFATVAVLSNNKVIAEKISAEDGSFLLQVTDNQPYQIRITHTAYQQVSLPIQLNGALKLATIVLQKQDNQLAGVTVATKRAFITRKTDRLVMDVSNNALTAGRSSLELFQLAPGVFVSNGKITINGNPGTRVMVNGKMLQLSGDDLIAYLSSLRADNIQSIEIIAHPPAEYDAEGSGGYINIVLKVQKTAGLNGSVNLGYTQGRYPGTNEGMQLNFKQNKVSLFASYNYDNTRDFEESRFFRNITDSITYLSITKRVTTATAHRVRAGGVYDIDKKQYVSIDYTGSFRNSGFSYNSDIVIAAPQPENNQKVLGSYPVTSSRNYHNLGVNYHLTLDTLGTAFILLSDYTSNRSATVSAAHSLFYDGGNAFIGDTSFRNRTPSTATVFTADARYTKVWKRNAVLNIGAKITNTGIENSGTYEGYTNDKWLGKNELDYVYNYHEDIVAGYVSYSGKILQTTLQLGIRGEHTHTEGKLETTGLVNARNYFNLFPTVYLKRNTNKKYNDYISFYYGKRVSRPSYSDLNPYESYADNYTIGRGNPYLNPSFIHSFELGYTFRNKYTVSVSYDRQKDMIAQYAMQSPIDSLITIYTRANFGKRTNAGITLYAPVAITKWWNWNNNVMLRRETVAMQHIDIRKTIVTIQANQQFILPANFSISLNTSYYSNFIFGNFLVNPFVVVDIGVQKKLMQNKLVLKASISDIGYGYRLNGKIYYSNSNIGSMEQKRQTRTFNLAAIYNFDLGKSFKARKIESSNADEQNRLK